MTDTRIRVDLVLPSAGGGGAEMHGTRVIKYLNPDVFAPRLVVFRGGGAYEKILPPEIPRIVLCPPGTKSSLWSTIRSVRPLEKLWRESCPDIVLSFLPHTHAVVSRSLRRFSRRPVVVLGVQNNVDHEIGKVSVRSLLFPGEPARAYRSADAIVSLSEGVAHNFARHFPSLSERVHVISNVGCESNTADRALEALPMEKPDGPVVVACGRLEEQKDYPNLIEAFSRMKTRPAPTLWILGRGKLESRLRDLAVSLGVGERVKFLGFQPNPFCFMAAADVFVLSSRWEGFGNVIVEAMASGTAVVSTDCPYGPAEILENGKFGRLVPVGNAAALADTLDATLGDESLRRSFSQLGVERAKEYLPEVIVPKFEELLLSLIRNSAAVN